MSDYDLIITSYTQPGKTVEIQHINTDMTSKEYFALMDAFKRAIEATVSRETKN